MNSTKFDKQTIDSMEKPERIHLINSLSGFKSANLIGTIDTNGVTNLSIVSSVVHLGAEPPLIGFVNRPHSVKRNTLDNIYQSKTFTINHVCSDFVQEAHHTSARYPANISEFDQTQLSEQYTSFNAPYVAQSKIKMGVIFKEKIDIKLNNTVFIIGEIYEIIIENGLILKDGKINIEEAKSVAVSGLDEYHITQSLGRMDYAKPKN